MQLSRSQTVMQSRGTAIGILFLLIAGLFVAACASSPPIQIVEKSARTVTLSADGETLELITEAANVRELLEEVGVTLNGQDEVTPPPFAPLTDNMRISVVRVTESIEILEETVPFDRRIVRSAAMEADAAPIILQGGKPGLQEITVRIVFRDGLEVERRRTLVTLVEEPQEEIVMVGVGTTVGDYYLPGTLAFISGGAALVMRESTAFPEQLPTGSGLDGRVFALSPTGSHLLYTRVLTATGRFGNSLWLLRTEPGAQPRDLGVENVLWADWNPARTDLLEIAYTTAIPVDTPPGWEANNDLWIGDILQSDLAPFEAEQVVEAYPATYSWWGGNYRWAPNGRFIAYAYADEIGLIDLESSGEELERRQLHTFTEYSTRSDWVWVPTLTWSPDARYLAFTSHGSDDPEEDLFDIWVADVETGIGGRFADRAGMWSHPHWSPYLEAPEPETGFAPSRIAYLRAVNPVDTLNSSYALWLMDQDGSNAGQVFPPAGESSRFAREELFMAWGPGGRNVAFIFDEALYLFSTESGEALRITQDDTIAIRPTWAPYGAALSTATDFETATMIPQPEPTPGARQYLPDE